MDQWNHMGIDVSAKTLDVALAGEGCRDSPDLLQLGRDCFLTAEEQSHEAKTA